MCEPKKEVTCNGKCDKCCTDLNIMKGNLKPYEVTVKVIVMATDRNNAIEVASGFDSEGNEIHGGNIPVMEELSMTAEVAEIGLDCPNPDILRTPPWGQPDSQSMLEVKDMFRMRKNYIRGFNNG